MPWVAAFISTGLFAILGSGFVMGVQEFMGFMAVWLFQELIIKFLNCRVFM
jgi:hypothetical protein